MQQSNIALIHNNIITNNQESGIFKAADFSATLFSIQYNAYFGNGTNFGSTGYTWTGQPGTGRIEKDPLYVGGSPFDYHLSKSSPCIDACDPTSLPDDDGSRADMGALSFDHSTKVKDFSKSQSLDFCLHPAYPNPFNPQTTISFQLPEQAYVELSIFNILGEYVAGLVHEELPAGMHTMTWNGLDKKRQIASSGIYFCRLKAILTENTRTPFINVKKIILSK